MTSSITIYPDNIPADLGKLVMGGCTQPLLRLAAGTPCTWKTFGAITA